MSTLSLQGLYAHVHTHLPPQKETSTHASTLHTHANKQVKIEEVLSTFCSSVLKYSRLCVTGDRTACKPLS